MLTLNCLPTADIQKIREDIASQVDRFVLMFASLPKEFWDAPEAHALRRDIARRRARLQLLDHVIACRDQMPAPGRMGHSINIRSSRSPVRSDTPPPLSSA